MALASEVPAGPVLLALFYRAKVMLLLGNHPHAFAAVALRRLEYAFTVGPVSLVSDAQRGKARSSLHQVVLARCHSEV